MLYKLLDGAFQVKSQVGATLALIVGQKNVVLMQPVHAV
jgi:hypothetical protein